MIRSSHHFLENTVNDGEYSINVTSCEDMNFESSGHLIDSLCPTFAQRGAVKCDPRYYLSGRKQAVLASGFQSSLIRVNKGVPQGSTVRPFLFQMFMS